MNKTAQLTLLCSILTLTACQKQQSEKKQETPDTTLVEAQSTEPTSHPNVLEEMPKCWDLHTASAHCIMPIEQELDRKMNDTEATLNATFTVDDIDFEARTITFTIGLPEVYNKDQIARLAPGDTLIAEGEELIISSVDNQDDWIEVFCTNDFRFYMGKNEDDATYTACGDSDWTFHHEVRKVCYPMSDDFVFVDCGEDVLDPQTTITAEKLQAYCKTLADYRTSFCYNDCKLSLQNGKIVRMERTWRP